MIGRTVLTRLQHHLTSPLHPLTVPTLKSIMLGRRPHLPQHIHQHLPHHRFPMQHFLIRYLHLETHPHPLTRIGGSARLNPAQQGSKWTTTLRVKSRSVHLPPAGYSLRRRSGRIERGLMGVSRSRSHWRARRESLPLVHHLPQRTKQGGMKGGPGKSRRSQQRPEGREHDELGRGDRQAVGGSVLTIAEFGGGGLQSPFPDDRGRRKESRNERFGDHSGH